MSRAAELLIRRTEVLEARERAWAAGNLEDEAFAERELQDINEELDKLLDNKNLEEKR